MAEITDRHRTVFALTSDQVAQAYEIPVEALLSSSRVEKHSWPRKVLYHVLRERFGWQYAVIGALVGRDVSTIRVGTLRVRRCIAADPDERYTVTNLQQGVVPLLPSNDADQALLASLTELESLRDEIDRVILRVKGRLAAGWEVVR